MELEDLNTALQQVIDTAIEMNRRKVNQGTSGNVSLRVECNQGSFYAITPTGLSYEELTTDQIVLMNMDNEPTSLEVTKDISRINICKPSSEYRFHGDIYKEFPEAKAIVHTHSKFATTLSCSEDFDGIPPFHYIIALSGGFIIPIADYALYGTEGLSRNILETLKKEKVKTCLMQNHGVVAFEKNLAKALNLAETVELLSEQYISMKAAGLKPKLLTTEEMKEVSSKILSYGQQNQSVSNEQTNSDSSRPSSKRKYSPTKGAA